MRPVLRMPSPNSVIRIMRLLRRNLLILRIKLMMMMWVRLKRQTLLIMSQPNRKIRITFIKLLSQSRSISSYSLMLFLRIMRKLRILELSSKATVLINTGIATRLVQNLMISLRFLKMVVIPSLLVTPKIHLRNYIRKHLVSLTIMLLLRIFLVMLLILVRSSVIKISITLSQ